MPKETYTEMLNRNFRAAYGDENVSRNSTCKYFSQATTQLEPKEREEPEMNGDTMYNHNGRDLTEVFETEIMDFDTPWNWIQDRIDNENFSGLMIGDYIPLTIDEHDWKAIIIGINTYKGFGALDVRVDTHIDFMLVGNDNNKRVFSNYRNNNSVDSSTPLWLTTDLYAWLNALKIEVVSTSEISMTTQEVDYTETGFILKLPESLKSLIVNRTGPMSLRPPSTTSLRTTDTGVYFGECGKLWLLSAPEVIPFNVTFISIAMVASYSVQYPFFAMNPRRISPGKYWLMSPDNTGVSMSYVDSTGRVNAANLTNTGINVYPCFRLQKTPEPAETP